MNDDERYESLEVQERYEIALDQNRDIIRSLLKNEARIGKEMFCLITLLADTPYAEGVAEIGLRIAGLIRENAEAAGVVIEEDDGEN